MLKKKHLLSANLYAMAMGHIFVILDILLVFDFLKNALLYNLCKKCKKSILTFNNLFQNKKGKLKNCFIYKYNFVKIRINIFYKFVTQRVKKRILRVVLIKFNKNKNFKAYFNHLNRF